MKILRKILFVLLAIILSTSVVACSGDEQITEYVFDYQVLDKKLVFELNGENPTDVIYKESSWIEIVPEYAVVGNKLEVQIEESMLTLGEDKFIKYNIGEVEHEIKFKLNAITENYYNVDQSDTFFLATAQKAKNVTLNGEKVAEGVKVSKTGITFSKSLFEGDKMGHNKLEYTVGGTKYVVSLCAITTAQLNAPITFEDGKLSPFIAVWGEEYRVIKASEADVVAQEKYANYTYQTINPDYTVASEVENKYLLEIDHKLGNPYTLKVYTSALWLKERTDYMQTHPYDERTVRRLDDFFNKEGGLDREYNTPLYFGVRRFSSTWFFSECSVLAGDTQDYVLNGIKIGGCTQFNRNLSEARALCDRGLYDATFNADGTFKYNFLSMQFSAPHEKAGDFKIYLDDFGGMLSPYGTNLLNTVTGYVND